MRALGLDTHVAFVILFLTLPPTNTKRILAMDS